jgi:hypothetical protein
LCTQAPFDGDLSPADIEVFLLDSIRHKHNWGMITIHGGEPVLNPWIYDIVRLLVEYRKSVGCKLWLLTNNSSPEIREKVSRISTRYEIPLGISTKIGKNIDAYGNLIDYITVNYSPCDSGKDYELGCFQTENCGVCYNYQGYFPCSPMAAAARVFGYKQAAKSISDLTYDKCVEYFKLHCKHCGFAAVDKQRANQQVTSTTWSKALLNYNSRRSE